MQVRYEAGAGRRVNLVGVMIYNEYDVVLTSMWFWKGLQWTGVMNKGGEVNDWKK